MNFHARAILQISWVSPSSAKSRSQLSLTKTKSADYVIIRLNGPKELKRQAYTFILHNGWQAWNDYNTFFETGYNFVEPNKGEN